MIWGSRLADSGVHSVNEHHRAAGRQRGRELQVSSMNGIPRGDQANSRSLRIT
jgi:hypothetical protein